MAAIGVEDWVGDILKSDRHLDGMPEKLDPCWRRPERDQSDWDDSQSPTNNAGSSSAGTIPLEPPRP